MFLHGPSRPKSFRIEALADYILLHTSLGTTYGVAAGQKSAWLTSTPHGLHALSPHHRAPHNSQRRVTALASDSMATLSQSRALSGVRAFTGIRPRQVAQVSNGCKVFMRRKDSYMVEVRT